MEKLLFKKSELKKYKIELADAHCHLDLLENNNFKEFISYGVLTLITNGINTKSNIQTLDLSDNKHIFPALWIDPLTALTINNTELDFNIKLIKENANKIVSIGEIGLDFKIAETNEAKNKQKQVFKKMLDLANKLNLPVSIHSRNSIEDISHFIQLMQLPHYQLPHLSRRNLFLQPTLQNPLNLIYQLLYFLHTDRSLLTSLDNPS